MEFKDCPHVDPTSIKKENYSSLPCHLPFQSPAFLMRLDEKKYSKEALQKQALKDIVRYESSFSEYDANEEYNRNEENNRNEEYSRNQENPACFGLTWQGKQEESHKRIRAEQRMLLQAYCSATKPMIIDISPIQDATLFHEEDWFFPQELP